MDRKSACPNCESRNQYCSVEVGAGGGYAPNYLPGLGSFWAAEKFNVVVCADCGLTRFFARSSAREELAESSKWRRI